MRATQRAQIKAWTHPVGTPVIVRGFDGIEFRANTAGRPHATDAGVWIRVEWGGFFRSTIPLDRVRPAEAK